MSAAGDGPSGVEVVARAAARYARILELLPPWFRERYGAELQADTRSLLLEAYARGGAGAVRRRFTVAALDVVRRAPAEWWRDGERTTERAGALWRSPRGRKSRPGEVLVHWLNELRRAARTLAGLPGFTLAAVLTLALGIGATVAIFAVVNAVLLRPLPYPGSERIVLIDHHAPGLNLPTVGNSHGSIALYEELARSLEAVALTETSRLNLTGADEPAQVQVLSVTPSFFDVVKVLPLRGRRLVASDVGADRTPLAILTHAAWQSRFGGAPDVIGRTIEIDGERAEVIGVMPRGFSYPDDETEVIVGLPLDRNAGFSDFGAEGIARLKPGITLEAGRREITALQQRIPERGELTADFLKAAGWNVTVTPLRDTRVTDVRTALWIVLGTVAFVLLIACANVANLFLVRAESRQRELAVRAALGASGGRMAWALLAESICLGVAGGVAGTAVATLAVRVLVAFGPGELPRLHEVSVDGRTLLLAAALSLMAGLLFGLLPWGRSSRRALEGLHGARGDTGTRERHRARGALIAAQVGLALVLLVGSGLLLRSFQRLRAVDPGFDRSQLLTLGVSYGDRDDPARVAAFYQQVIDEVAALPGVVAVGGSNSLPIRPSGLNGGSFSLESQPRADDQMPPVALFALVAPGFFETLGIPLRQGRNVERADRERDAPVVWVNERFVRDFLGGKDPLGERIRFSDADPWLEIAGVVGDVRWEGLDREIRPMAYIPMGTRKHDVSAGVLQLVVRTSGDPLRALPEARAIIQRLGPDVPLTTARTMDDLVAESMVNRTFTMTVLGIAAAVALLLGAIGLYGVISYVVAQRTREIGVRLALGAGPARVRSMVVIQGLRVVAIGAAIGLAAAFGLTRLMQSMLFEVRPFDPLTFAAVLIVLLAVSALACYLPARRASGVNPMAALRAE